MDAAFLEAANPRRFKILGLPLQPLTLGHRFLLVQHGSAFVLDQQAKVEDLMLSVFICAQPWRQAERNLTAWWFKIFVWLWSQTLRKTVLQLEYQKFHAYFNAAHTSPQIISKGEASEVGSPYEYRLLVFLMTELAMTMEAALDVTLARANCLWATRGEMTGGIELLGERRQALWEYARQQDLAKFGAN